MLSVWKPSLRLRGHLQMQGNSKRLSEMMSLFFIMILQRFLVSKGYQKKRLNQLRRKIKNWLQRALAMLAEIFTPIIPAIIVGGLILGFRNILEGVEWSALNGKTIVEVSQFWSGVNSFLWLPGEAIFHYLPVGIVWSVTRKWELARFWGLFWGFV